MTVGESDEEEMKSRRGQARGGVTEKGGVLETTLRALWCDRIV